MKFTFYAQDLDPEYEVEVLVDFNPKTDVVTLFRLDTQKEISENDLSIKDLEIYKYEYNQCVYHRESEIAEEIKASNDDVRYEETYSNGEE